MSRLLSLPAAALFAIVISGQSTAATWSPRVNVGHQVFASGLAGLANGVAVAVYEKCVDIGGGMCVGEVRLKRSTDNGQTWGSSLVIDGNDFSDADMAAVAGRGSNVDVVWRGRNGYLRYARSTNAGVSFNASLKLNGEYSTDEPTVARGPAGVVAVAWGESPEFVDQISVRVSTNGGSSFGPKSSWRTANTAESSVAVGDGVVYITYLNAAGLPVVRASVDGGATWSAAFRLTNTPVFEAPAIAAEGSDAYVAYVKNGVANYRQSVDKGSSWSSAHAMTPASMSVDELALSLHEGTLRAIFQTADGLFYQRLTRVAPWSAPEPVTQSSVGQAFLGYADRAIVLYDSEPDIYAKTRVPD